MLAYVLLGLAQSIGLLLIPIGAPGVWFQLAALAVFGWWTGFAAIGVIPLLILAVIALTAELTALVAGASKADPGYRRRLGFAGLAAGGAGAVLGSPFPLMGSLFGALLGAFAGSVLGSFGGKSVDRTRGHRGSLVIATTMKTAAGISVAAFTTLSLLL